MKDFTITSIEEGLSYCGEVTGVRQTYYVFEARDYFFVLSFSRAKAGSGNFNVVSKKAVHYVHDKFAGCTDVTANDVVSKANRTKHAPNSLAALNILYVMVALGFAELEGAGEHQQLFFSVHKKRFK